MVNGKETASLIFKIFIVILPAKIQIVYTAGALTNESSETRGFVSGPDAGIAKTTTDDYYGYDGYDSQYDPTEMFRLGTDYCNDKAACSAWPELSFPSKSCYCDRMCGILGDCCANYEFKSESSLTKDQFSCVNMFEIVKNLQFGVNLVTKCAPDWDDSKTKQLCENIFNTDDILLKLPVSELSEEAIMYKNMYCAQCNNVFDYKFWKAEKKCREELGVRSWPEMKGCDWFYIRPDKHLEYRICQLSPEIVEWCPHVNISGDESSKRCNDNLYSIVYDKSRVYKNKYCALCNGILDENLFCELFFSGISPEQSTIAPDPKKDYSFRRLVDFNSGTISENDVNIDVPECKDNEIYDGFSAKCREIYCAPPRLAAKGKCIMGLLYSEDKSQARSGSYNDSAEKDCKNSTLMKLVPSEYNLINNSHLFIICQQKVYTKDDFLTHGSDVFICKSKLLENLYDCNRTDVMFQFENLESYLTLACLIISITSLVITLIIYLFFPQLRNTPGKLLMCLIIFLLLGQTLFIISSKVEYIMALCKTVAVAEHFCFLAAFCWMNVIALDLWMTFSNRFVTVGTSNKQTKRFALYSLYAWLTPVIIVTTSVVLDIVDIDPSFSYLKPQYGKRACWISSKYSLILFFAGPLALFKLFDITAFIFTAVHIARAKREGAMASKKKNTCSFLINLKLSLIMGLTWVFAFVANVSNATVMWYMFIIFNGLQGFFIALSFLCTRKVGRLLKNKYQQMSSSGTQVTSLS